MFVYMGGARPFRESGARMSVLAWGGGRGEGWIRGGGFFLVCKSFEGGGNFFFVFDSLLE